MKRGDVLLNWLIVLVRSLHWFNPLVWPALRRLRADRELVCDAMALHHLNGAERRLYGHTLLKLLEDFSPVPPAPSFAPVINSKNELKRRITMIAKYQPPGRLAWSLTVALAVTLCCLTFTRAAVDNQQPGGAALDATAKNLSSEGTETHANPSAIERLKRRLQVQEEKVSAVQKKVDALRSALGGVSEETATPGLDAQTVRMFERERIAALARKAQFEKLAEIIKFQKQQDNSKLRQMLPTAVPDTLLTSLLDRLSVAESELAIEKQQKGSSHPDVQSLAAVISNLNQQIDQRVDGILAGLSAQIAAQEASADQLRHLVEQAKARDAEQLQRYAPYFRAKRELEAAQRIKETIQLRLLQEQVDAELRESTPPANAAKQEH